jgi:2',3'-cyclic-nucleotide 2'-phosphodiesterase (5'-nucleotidase family)
LGIALVLLFFWIGSCFKAEGQTKSFVILAINDVYRIAGVEEGARGGLPRLRTLRKQLEEDHPDLLLLHAGDFLFPSLISRLYDGEQMVKVLNLLDGDAGADDKRMFVTFGNHEFDKGKLEDATMLDKRIQESQFYWLSSNLTFGVCPYDDPKKCPKGLPLVRHKQGQDPKLWDGKVVESNKVKVGLFGLTIDSTEPKYVESFKHPVEIARKRSEELRNKGAEVVIALTHLSLSQDKEILEKLGEAGPDLIIGGHEHNRLAENVGGRWIIKADADLRTATVAEVILPPTGSPQVNFQHVSLGPVIPSLDSVVGDKVKFWLDKHDKEYCTKKLKEKPPCLAAIRGGPGCLNRPLGRTQVDLVAEELEIRRVETNLGNWVADQALAAFANEGAQIAFINSGSLRLNQDLPAGTDIRLRHLEELFQFENKLKLLKITGDTLEKVVAHAVKDWPGSGRFLQISGFSFRHDPDTGKADQLMLVAPDGTRTAIKDEDELLAVTNDFLVDPKLGDQDGYTMLGLQQKEPGGDGPALSNVACERLKAAGTAPTQGINPKVDGRICNTKYPERCPKPKP